MNHPFKLKNAALLMALSAIYPLHVYGAAGVAQFSVGDVNVRRGVAATPLAKGQAIESGDSIVTGNAGQAQIRFTDGGLVSLSPNSQFNIDKYADENDAGKDSFAVSFLRGGMRAITGLIGKRNRENYKVTTSTATIGIRGSGFSGRINPDGTMDVAGEQDAIEVCTNAGCIGLIVGEVVRVTDNNSLPRRTSQRSNVPPLVAREDRINPERREDINQLELPLANGVLGGVSALFAFGDSFIDGYPRGGEDSSTGIGTFVDGQMVSHEVPTYYGGGSVIVQKTSSGAGTFGQVGNPTDRGFIGWGYWDAGKITSTGELVQQSALSLSDGPQEFAGIHYIVGRPTPQIQMPVTGTAVYNLFTGPGGFLSGTAPTATLEGTSIFGTLVNAGLNVDFGIGRLSGFINTEFVKGGVVVPVQIYDSGSVYGSTFYSDGEGSGYFNGFFTGAQAGRAGLVYETDNGVVGYVQGAAVLLRNGSARQVEHVLALFASSDDQYFGNNVFNYFPNNGSNPSTGTGTFIGNQMYMHDDGEDSGQGSRRFSSSSTVHAATSPVSSSGSLGNVGDPDFIGWGYWAKGQELSSYGGNSAMTGVHYLVGRPAQQSQMPASGTATYSMAGGTPPTATLNGVTSVGRLDSAFLRDVNFGTGSMSIEVDTTFVKNGANVSVQLRESGNINRNINGNLSLFSASGNCGGNVKGFFTGDQATRAGMIYRQDSSVTRFSAPANIGVVQGAVALTRGAITPAPILVPPQ